MRLNSKVVVLVAGAMLVLAASAAMAFAAAAQHQTVALQVGDEMGNGYYGNYGDEIVLQPASMTSIERPGEKFHFQVWVMDVESSGTAIPTGMKWMDFRDFEDVQLEDTNTVPALGFEVGKDDAVVLSDGSTIIPTPPYLIRCEYKALDDSGTANSTSPSSFSETETVNVIKNTNTKVKISTKGTVRRAGTYFSFRVTANSGIGRIKVTVKKSGSPTKTYYVTTNEDGVVSPKLKLGSSKGTYKVYAKFLGNAYGNASVTFTKTLRASH